MSWLTLTVTAPASQAEMLSEALLQLGALSVDLHDADVDTPQEQAMFGDDPAPRCALPNPLPGGEGANGVLRTAQTLNEPVAQCWPHNRITALFAEDVAIDAIMLQATHAIGLDQPPAYSIATLADNDWVRLTQAQFNPIRISLRLWIVPTWHTPSDPAAINITLDPGLAFGTGSHPTTRLCLRWLDDHIKGDESVLDYGCGSGILAIAALKLGASSAIGVDVEPQAVQASRDNAAANHVAAKFYLPDAAPRQETDIVVANILTNPLKLLAPLLAGATRPGGHIVLSGILSAQAEDVMKVYAQWFNLKPPVMEDGWVCLSGIKR